MSNRIRSHAPFIKHFAFFIQIAFMPVMLSAQHDVCGMQDCDRASTSMHKGVAPHGGAYLPTAGMVRGLVVFAQTLNDEVQNEGWPLGELPWWAHEYAARLQRYFHDMSFGKLDLRLDVHPNCMVTRYTENGYVDWAKNYGHAIKDLIDTLDVSIDFSDYDLWTSQSSMYRLKPGPDGQVDLMIVIYRRTENARFLPFSGVSDLGFPGYKFVDGSLARFFYGGSGQFNDAAASGLTLCKRPGYGVIVDDEAAFNITVHELGHKFFGDSHPAEIYGALGIMASAGNGYAMNSFERQLAGYISFRELTPHRDTIVTLRDYVTTGDAVLLPVPEGILSFYSFEFRNKLSEWDSAPVRGLYAFRIYDSPGNSSKKIQVASAEGRFDWAVDSTTMTVHPVRANPLGGYTRHQRIYIEGKAYAAIGAGGDARSAYTLDRPELAILKNPTPDFIFGSDTIRTGLRITLLAMDDSIATLQISYQQPTILSSDELTSGSFTLGTAYPQPVESFSLLRLPVHTQQAGIATIDVFDMLGRRILHRTNILYTPGGEIILPMSGIPAGVHALIVQAGGAILRLRISVTSP